MKDGRIGPLLCVIWNSSRVTGGHTAVRRVRRRVEHPSHYQFKTSAPEHLLHILRVKL